MSSTASANEGRSICDDLTNTNKGDYLTSLVVNEASGIINEIASLDGDIAGVASAVEAKRREIAAREAEIKKKAERKNRAKEVEEALKVANDAQNKAIQLLKDFTRDYGYFHISYTKDDVKSDKSDKTDFFSIINDFISF